MFFLFLSLKTTAGKNENVNANPHPGRRASKDNNRLAKTGKGIWER